MGAIALLAVAAVVAACAQPGAPTSPAATAAAPSPAATAPAATTPPASAAAGPTIDVTTDAQFGAIVTGANGLSLYLFTNDTGGISACTGDCAGSWPPLTVASASELTTGADVTGALGTITRDDGSLQVTLGGAPLYYFTGDEAAGDTKGQGLFEKWYLVSPAGTAVEDAVAGASPQASKCGGPACY